MNATLIMCRIGSSSTIDNTEGADAVRVHGLATTIHQWVVRVAIRVSAVGGRIGCIAARVAVAVRVGHAAGQSRRCLAVGARRGVAPATVSTVILSHGEATDGWKGRIVIGIVAILLDLLSALILVALALLALSPEEDATQHKQGDDYDRNNDGDGCLAARAQPAGAV